MPTYADDITAFVSNRPDIKAIKKAVARYEQIAGAKINFDKNERLRLISWWDGVPLPEPLRCNLGVWFGPGLEGTGQGGIVRRVHFPRYPLPFVCISSA